VSQAPASTAGLEAIDSYAAELVAVAATAETVAGLFDGATDVFPLAAHTAAEITDMQSRARAAVSQISSAQTKNDKARAAEKKRLDDARKAAEAAARKAAADAARQAAERAAAEAAPQAARTAAQAPVRQSSSAGSRASSSGSSSSGNSSSSGGSGYTGCRSYAPGGKSWTPITC
jgi:micrococcal nuclease